MLCRVYNEINSFQRYGLSYNQCVFVAAYTVSCNVVIVLVCCLRSAPEADRERIFKGLSKEGGSRP